MQEQSGTSALNKAGRSSLEPFMGREAVSEAVLKWFEYEGRAKELGTLRVLPGAAEHQRAFLILIREVQRQKDNHAALAQLFRRIVLLF